MTRIMISLLIVLTTACFSPSSAQEQPTDLMNTLPELFPGICSAKNTEVASYAKMLKKYSENVSKSLDLLSDLKAKAMRSSKINANVDTRALQKELDKVKGSLALLMDCGAAFNKAMHNDAEVKMNAEMDAVNLKAKQTDDWKELERLSIETVKIRTEYCEVSSPHYFELLTQQRAMLTQNISNLVYASDLKQKIDCQLLGYTYFPELSFEDAYILLLDHLNNMNLYLSFAPGNE